MLRTIYDQSVFEYGDVYFILLVDIICNVVSVLGHLSSSQAACNEKRSGEKFLYARGIPGCEFGVFSENEKAGTINRVTEARIVRQDKRCE